ncbi:hypothetical protein PPL_05578 [Heterostelium album PN500]|uniref:WD40 repeat-containing protein n=1 Tax=Heterostelium pallidum (strain ATCC 26659 / Pp 5 / PN500) TaxID=670386 RepID=D3BAK0_HETP5|nr:hypothetical protein PPL_05578 [Heterostelium album PN500]EFA81587.1 hypothetical protein PPL_05578 [Heterostelium album PN500]|eukprot:XP_020433704.1 hypothetical protein PPL_05578 [Heterostelium album PN500]
MELLHSFGVGSSRYISCINDDDNNNEFEITLAIGPSVCKWDIKRGRQLLFKQLHSDVITCLVRLSNSYYISASYSGDVAIYNHQWQSLVEFKLPLREDIPNDCIKIMHLSYWIDPNDSNLIYVGLSSEHGNCRVYIVKFDMTEKLASLAATLDGNLYFYGELFDCDKILVVRQDVGKDGYQDARTLKVGDNKIELVTLNWRTGQTLNKLESPGKGCTALVRDISSNIITLTRGRVIQVLDMDTLTIKWEIETAGSGLIKDLLLTTSTNESDQQKYQIIVPSSNSMIYIYNKIGNTDSNSSGSSSSYSIKSSHGVVYAMRWAVKNQRIWIFDESGLHNLSIEEQFKYDSSKVVSPIAPISQQDVPPYYQLKFHEITCCGVDFNDDGLMVACGDFMGNLLIWSVADDHIGEQPIQSHILGVPVRSLAWNACPTQTFIIVGLMDGSLMYYSLETKKSTMIDNLNDGITAIQWYNNSNNSNSPLLAVGTTGGNLYIYKYDDYAICEDDENEKEDDEEEEEVDEDEKEKIRIQCKFKLTWKKQVHLPKKGEPQDLKFGSIIHFAEIWSLCFNDQGDKIATCSEDQTIAVWMVTDGAEVSVMQGHTLAVTCVDWHDNILASCADDHTIRLWNTTNWTENLKFQTTNDVGEWHTVTYLSLVKKTNSINNNSNNNNSNNINSNNNTDSNHDNYKNYQVTKVYSKRVHLGSIEGLKWNKKKNRIVSCSSDCLIHVYKLLK